MCGDGIIYMCNVNFVTQPLNLNTSTRNYAPMIVKEKRGQYLLENIRTQTRGENVLSDGMEIPLDRYQNIDIGQNPERSIYKSYEQIDIIKNIQKRKKGLIKNMLLDEGDTTQDMLIGMRLIT